MKLFILFRIKINMQQSIVGAFFGMVAFFFLYSVSSASVISCPPSSIQQEMNPKISQLCFAIEQALQDSPPQSDACKNFFFI